MRKALATVLMLGLMLMAAPTVVRPTPGAYTHLDPGALAHLQEQVPVNVVFLGYTPGDVDETTFLKALPAEYRPVVRAHLWYGKTTYLGIHYTYDYRVTFADEAYQNQFFAMLAEQAQPADLTLFQQQYNDQDRNVLDVTDNHFIDAPAVERWLATNPPAGVNTTENTVFFINWWGNGQTPRAGFKHHVYTKFGEPDPDTGYDFGVNRQSRKIIAWGGTPPDDPETGPGSLHRIWFYDLSAGPESWTDNWNVDDADVDGDGEADYRMPPIWEYYMTGGARQAGDVTRDLALVARYAAINLLFTPSPLYAPTLTPLRLPESISLDFNTYQGSRRLGDANQYMKPALVAEKVMAVHRIPYTFDVQNLTYRREAKTCYEQFVRGTRCMPSRPQYPADANLFLHNALNRQQAVDGGADYEALFFNYATDDNVDAPFLGMADDNWYDGTQSFTFNVVSPAIVELGYGLTTTQIHEYGHHFGMSHPHDGYDYEENIDYEPSGRFLFVNAADEVNSIMSYIDLNMDFSQFDRDNANRWQAAGYINTANAIAKLVLESPNATAAAAHLGHADGLVGEAMTAMAAHDYATTFDKAREAYHHATYAAAAAGVELEASSLGWYVMDPVKGKEKKPAKQRDAYIDRINPDVKRMAP